MIENFNTSLRFVLADEGGNDDDPRDHGGRTSRGITQREYDHWCSLNNKAGGDVWNATDEDIGAIYKDQYWAPYCDTLPGGLDYLFFDISVNAGRSQAVRQFQKAVGVNVDGMMGVVTLSAISMYQDTPELIKRISDVRRAFYTHLKQFNIYGHGWLNRVDHSEKNALSMSQPGEPKPSVPSVKATEPAQALVSPEAAGSATGGLLAILASAKEQLQQLSGYMPNLNYVILCVVALGLGYTAYSWWHRNQVQQAL